MMTVLVAMRRAPRVRFSLLAGAALITPILLALAKGWLYAHPLRLASTNGKELVGQGIMYEEITLRSADGIVLSAWYTPPGNEALILVGHGYASVRPANMHALFARNGFGVLSWDFRAHGKSQGRLCTVGHDEVLDVEAALDYAFTKPRVAWVSLWGGSMGGAAALHAARYPELWFEPGDGHLKMIADHPEEYERRVIEFFQQARNRK